MSYTYDPSQKSNEPKVRQKHDYTSELELKSLLIRVKNRKIKLGLPQKHNSKINRYIKTYVKLHRTKYAEVEKIQRKKQLKYKIKQQIISLSEQTEIDTFSHENFGSIILLMIKSILTKPNFSGYTYKTDFYSDAIHKILKYLHNFDHTLISERSGINVNAFAYISQIIHNSIVFIINTKKKELIRMQDQFSTEIMDHNLNIPNYNRVFASTVEFKGEFEQIKHKEFRIEIKKDSTLVNEIIKIREKEEALGSLEHESIVVYYPSSYRITMDEYYDLKPLLINTSVVRY
jgi:hypothetical protein